jgi:hypothetical protein
VPSVKLGFFPLDEQLQLPTGHWSEEVVKAAVWLSGLMAFAQVEEVLQRIARIHISTQSIWRMTQACGQRLAALEAQQQERAMTLPPKWQPPVDGGRPRPRLGVTMDGAMIHLRQEGWKELKVGAVFAVAVQPTLHPPTQELVEAAHAVENSYVAHLGAPPRFGEKLWAEAHRRGWQAALDTQAIGDGAAWIWNLVTHHFGESRQVVDWYHAKAHLATAARLLIGEETAAAQRWLNRRATSLYQGHADRIAHELLNAAAQQPQFADDLRREATYFRQNQHRMYYLEMREENWVIGSGAVESAAKQFKARFCGPGMRWSRQGAEHLLPIRTAILSHRFDQLWSRSLLSPPN